MENEARSHLWKIALLIVLVVFVSTVMRGDTPAQAPSGTKIDIADISQPVNAVPLQIRLERPKMENKTVAVNLKATQIVGQLDNGVTYEYWTYNNKVPGPFIRVMEGDTVQVELTHEHAHGAEHAVADENEQTFTIESFTPIALADEDGHMMSAEQVEHMAAGHGEHSIDLHSVLGPGGGAEMTRVGPNETKVFQFKAMRPGLYIYHCASPHVPSHIANGMYGLILVEPKGGLPIVDKEFYVVQGEFYTTGKLGEKGLQGLDKEKLLAEKPEYIVFNGKKGALVGSGALKANVGEKVRIFFGVSGQIPSNFHIIGGVLENLYPEGDIISPPHKNVQTTLVPAGGATMVEFTTEVPGRFLLVDHALTRAIDRGAIGELIVSGPEQPEIIKKIR